MNNKSTALGGRALVRLLKALAQVNAFAEVDDQDSEQPRVRVYCKVGSADLLDVKHHAAWDVWQRAQAAGLVECCGECTPVRWVISSLGRERLGASLAQMQPLGGGDGAQSTAGERRQVNARKSRTRPEEVSNESPLGWLYRRRDKSGETLISQPQFEAGERLRLDYEIAQLMPRLTIDWSRAASGGSRTSPGAQRGMELSERAIAARERVSRALSSVGPELASLLVDVCCHLKGLEQLERAAGWPQRSAKIVLQVALSSLARHYGLERADRGHGLGNKGPTAVRHWGAEGYRPEAVTTHRDTDSAS